MVPDEAHEEQEASEGKRSNRIWKITFKSVFFFRFTVEQMSTQTHREGGEQDTDESWSSPDSSDEDDGGPDHVQCMSS